MKEWEDEEGKKVIIKYYQTGSFWGNLDTCSTHIAQKFPSHENLLRQGSRNFFNITFTENGGFVNVAMAVYDCLQNMVPPTWLGAPSRARWLNVRLGQLSNIFQKPPLLHLQNLRFQWKNFQWTWSYIFAIQNSSVKVVIYHFIFSCPQSLIVAFINIWRSWTYPLKKYFFKWSIPGLFFLFSSFQYKVDNIQLFDINFFLPMTGFEPRTSAIGSDRSTNWATITSPKYLL